MLGSDGANYMSIEFHGEGVASLSVSERMTVANFASEMGAKNAVFRLIRCCRCSLVPTLPGIWADEGAEYKSSISIDLSEVFPLVAAPHHVDNIKSVASVAGTVVHRRTDRHLHQWQD